MKTFFSFSILLMLAGVLSLSACQKAEDQAATSEEGSVATTQPADLTPQIPDDIREAIEAKKAEEQAQATTQPAAVVDPTSQVVGAVSLSKKLTPEGIEKYAGKPGVVRLRWKTQSEKENFGFNVLRSTSEDGEFNIINKDIIAGAGNSSTERSYEYYDTTVKVGEEYYYYLVDIKINSTQSEIVPKTPIMVKYLNLDEVAESDTDPADFLQD